MKLYTLTFSTLYSTNFLLHICILYFELYSFCALNAYITCTILYNCAIKTHLVLVDVKDGMCTRKTGHNNKEGKRKGVTKKSIFSVLWSGYCGRYREDVKGTEHYGKITYGVGSNWNTLGLWA